MMNRAREVVVDDAGRVTVIAFQAAAGCSYPGVMHGAGKNAEVIQRCPGRELDQIAKKRRGLIEAERYDLPAIG